MATSTSRRSSASRRSRRRAPQARRGPALRPAAVSQSSALLGNAAFVLLGVAVLALVATLVVACQGPRANRVSTPTTAAGASPSATASAMAGAWISLRSNAPADVLAAARQSPMFQQNLDGNGDHASSLSNLGSPVFVRALQPAGATTGQFPDFYVVPILDGSGATTDAAELALNPSRTAIQVIAIVTYSQPHADGAIAQVSASAAVAAVQAQQHVAVRAGASPEPILLPGRRCGASVGPGDVDRWWGVPGRSDLARAGLGRTRLSGRR